METTPAVVLAAEIVNELPMPAWMYGVIALVGFAALALVTYSYRDVANRHSQKRPPQSGGHH